MTIPPNLINLICFLVYSAPLNMFLSSYKKNVKIQMLTLMMKMNLIGLSIPLEWRTIANTWTHFEAD